GRTGRNAITGEHHGSGAPRADWNHGRFQAPSESEHRGWLRGVASLNDRAQMNYQAVALCVPRVGTGLEHIHHNSRNRRSVLKLINPNCADLLTANGKTLTAQGNIGVRQINHEAQWAVDFLHGGNKGTAVDDFH